MSPPPVAAAREQPSVRAPVGHTPSIQRRLTLQRPRPFYLSIHRALLAEQGVLGAPVRRRLGRFLLRSLPAVVAVSVGALVPLGAFAGLTLGAPPLVALAVLGAALAGVLWRRVAGAAAGRVASYREQLELGSLFVVAAYAAAQVSGAGSPEAPFQPVVYLVVAFLVSFLAPAVGAALVVLAVALEGLAWAARGGNGAELPDTLLHAAFVVVFAALYNAVLAARMAASRREERQAVERRVKALEQSAREFRILGGEDEDRAARERRWTEAAVIEIEGAVRGALEVVEAALRPHTCALYWLGADDRSLVLRDARTRAEGLARGPLPAGEGALGAALKTLAPVNVREKKAACWYEDGTRPATALVVPVVERRGGHVRGVLIADRLEPIPFTEADEALFQTLSAEILRAVDAERMMRDVRHAKAETQRFYGAIQLLNQQSKQVEVIDALIGVARDMAPVDFVAVVLRDEADPGRLVVARVSSGEGKDARETAALAGYAFPCTEGQVARAIEHGHTLPYADIKDFNKTPVFGQTCLKGLGSLKILPLLAASRALGALVVGSKRPHAYGRETVQQLEVVANHAAQSLDRARLFDQTERLATTDGLTGLVNHRTFQERLDGHLGLAARHGKKVSLILCDIDHFKSVNDTYGHPVGDLVLKAVAKALAREARTTDVVARYGGEEFAVVMPETDTAGALVIAERIRKAVGEVVTTTEKGPLQVTLSLGVATFPEDAERKPELVEKADGCLYQAKRGGRNRSVAAGTRGTVAPGRGA